MLLARRKRNFAALLPIVGLLLLYVLSRSYHVLALPPFLDESEQMRYGQEADRGLFLGGGNNGRMLGGWWTGILQPNGDATLWLSRTATVLFVLISVAAIYSTASYWLSRGAGLLAVALYILMPFALFHDRLALSDPYASVFGALSLWFASCYTARGRISDALLSGLCVTAAILGKATGILLTVIPAVVFLLGMPWSRRGWLVRGLLAAYGAFAVTAIPIYVYLRAIGDNYFGVPTSGSIGTTDVSNLPARLLKNIQTVRAMEVGYLSWPFAVAAVILALYLIVRRPRTGLTLTALIVLPLLGMLSFGLKISGRYVMFHLPTLAILLGMALAVLTGDLRRYARLPVILAGAIPLTLVAAWAILVALPFAAAMYSNPGSQTLPASDQYEYIQHDASGYGLSDAAGYLLSQQFRQSEPIHIIGLLSNCRGLEHMVPLTSGVVVECPGIVSDGSQQAQIAAAINAEALDATVHHYDLWLVNEQLPFVSMDGITAPHQAISTFNRPGNLTHVTLYHFIGQP